MSTHTGGSAASHLTPVRLIDVPFKQRMAAARSVAQSCVTPKEAYEVMAAALSPSDKTYWIRAAAADEALVA